MSQQTTELLEISADRDDAGLALQVLKNIVTSDTKFEDGSPRTLVQYDELAEFAPQLMNYVGDLHKILDQLINDSLPRPQMPDDFEITKRHIVYVRNYNLCVDEKEKVNETDKQSVFNYLVKHSTEIKEPEWIQDLRKSLSHEINTPITTIIMRLRDISDLQRGSLFKDIGWDEFLPNGYFGQGTRMRKSDAVEMHRKIIMDYVERIENSLILKGHDILLTDPKDFKKLDQCVLDSTPAGSEVRLPYGGIGQYAEFMALPTTFVALAIRAAVINAGNAGSTKIYMNVDVTGTHLVIRVIDNGTGIINAESKSVRNIKDTDELIQKHGYMDKKKPTSGGGIKGIRKLGIDYRLVNNEPGNDPFVTGKNTGATAIISIPLLNPTES